MKYGVSKKYAEKWADKIFEDYLKSDEYEKDKIKMDEEVKDFIVFGKPTTYFNDDLLQEIKDFNKNK